MNTSNRIQSAAGPRDIELLFADPTRSSSAAERTNLTTAVNQVGRLFERKASKRSLLMAFRQLALLVETGIDISEALELVATNCRHPVLKKSLLQIFEDIRNGNSLSVAVTGQKEVLGHEVTASLEAGEVSGRLVDVLRQIAAQLQEELSIRSTISAALAYPAILCSASLGVGAVLVWFVLPQFEDSFASMGVEPPLITSLLFSVSRFLRGNVWLVGGVTLGCAAMFIVILARPQTRRLFDEFCFNCPGLGQTFRSLRVGKLFLNLGHLLNNGISILEAIQIVQKSSATGAMKRLTDVWEHDVLEGRGLSHSLDSFNCLPEGAEAMLVMAERTGKLGTVLTTAGAYYRDEGSSRLRQLLKLSEPLIIIGLGVFVGVVVASVLLPILDVQAGAAG